MDAKPVICVELGVPGSAVIPDFGAMRQEEPVCLSLTMNLPADSGNRQEPERKSGCEVRTRRARTPKKHSPRDQAAIMGAHWKSTALLLVRKCLPPQGDGVGFYPGAPGICLVEKVAEGALQ
jgi:hypothetical protein